MVAAAGERGGARAGGVEGESCEQLFPIPAGAGRAGPGAGGRAGAQGAAPGPPTLPRCRAEPGKRGGAQPARSGWPEQTKINWLLSEQALKMQTAACARSY